MTLHTNGRSRERIVVFGTEGTGKSLAALDIAAAIHPARLYVVDNDNAWDRMLEGQTLAGQSVNVAEEYRWDADSKSWTADYEWVVEGGNVVVFHADGWDANTAAIRAVVEEATRDDWCCVDSGSALWDDVQRWYTMSIFDSSMSDYFLRVRMEKEAAKAKLQKGEKEAKALGAFDGWMDWPVINAVYKERTMDFFITPPCHLIVCCEQADVDAKEEKDKDTRALYSGAWVKPRGQKRIGHNMQTVIQMARDQSGKHYATTFKDRGGREKMSRLDVTDVGFASFYLADIAGWTEAEKVKVAAKSVAKKIVVKKG